MALYEIMFILSGSLSENETSKLCKTLVAPFSKEKNFKLQELGLKQLAYPIKKNTNGWYYLINCETNNNDLLKNFSSAINLDNNALRYLIVNLEKDYGYNATLNPKKVEKAKKKFAIYQEKRAEFEERKNTFKKNKEENNEMSSIVDTVMSHSDDKNETSESTKKIVASKLKKETKETVKKVAAKKETVKKVAAKKETKETVKKVVKKEKK